MRHPLAPLSVDELLHKTEPDRLPRILHVSPLVGGEYAPWDTVIRLAPPSGLTSEDWWLGIRLARNQLLNPVPLHDASGAAFGVGMPDPALRLVYEIDRRASKVARPSTRDQDAFESLVEEAITSSQLEGAGTASKVARDMLRSGRKPMDHGERMIFNNFRAMEFVKDNVAEELTPALVLDLHRVVAEHTLRDPNKAGQLRSEADRICVMDRYGTVVHRPPPAHELEERLKAMCRFANARDRPEDPFLHPIVRAIVLHFWVGHDHPFVDGNGRTARAIFYWSLLSRGYGLAEYISVSRTLLREPGNYGRAFLHTETDGNDLTYFVLHQLNVIRSALEDLDRRQDRKAAQVRQIDRLLAEAAESGQSAESTGQSAESAAQSAHFNHRQRAVLAHAVRHPGARYTIRSHRRSHGIAYDTARTDLMELAEVDLLWQWREGRTYVFSPPEDLEKRLADWSRRNAARQERRPASSPTRVPRRGARGGTDSGQ